jgi:hypothetical protein
MNKCRRCGTRFDPAFSNSKVLCGDCCEIVQGPATSSPRPLASYLEPWIADGDPLPETITLPAADVLEAVGELRRMREAAQVVVDVYNQADDINVGYDWMFVQLAAALAPADG